MNKTITLVLVVFVIGLAVGAGLVQSVGSPQQRTVTQTLAKNVPTLVTTTATRTLTLQIATTQTTTITQDQGAVTQTVTLSGGGSLVQYCFSPGGHCDQVIIDLINHATTSVHVLIYSFTLQNVAQALVDAKNRGLDVEVVMDTSQHSGTGSQYSFMVQNCGCVRLDGNPNGIMHAKVAIIDGHIIISGSYNWSKSANLYNNEVLTVIDNQQWGTAFENDFQTIWSAGA